MKEFRYIDNTAILRFSIEKCIGCGHCIEVCPHRVFALKNGKASMNDPNACMECGACAQNCPDNALYVNPDDGCGCATFIIQKYLARLLGKSAPRCC